MPKNTMSWIVVGLLIIIITLLSICIYLDIEFTSAFTSSSVPNTTVAGTSSVVPTTTLSPALTTTAAPITSNTPVTTIVPETTAKQTVTTTPTTTTAAPITSEAPTTTKAPQISPDAPTVCIDAGHGFSDPGAIRKLEATGVFYNEADINLAISLKLRDELTALGYNVIMTHDGVNLPAAKYLTKTDDGTFFYVNERNQWIKDHKNEIDLVISIHCNTADPSISGTRFYILEYGSSGSNSKSVPLAESLCVATHNAFGTTPPKNKYNTQSLAVLKTGIPSVLVESAFMSNNAGANCDLAKLIDPAWQNTFAKALAQGVKNYFA